MPSDIKDKEQYEKERSTAISGSTKARLSLAGNSQTHKEILYYMAAHDKAPEVREAVAKNPSLPVQASTVLSKDSSEDVRLQLAQRVIHLLPGLDEYKHGELYAFVVQALGDLAVDEVVKIRKALAETLKDHAYAPPKIAGQLARDIEREVSEPILRFCAALSDEDIIEILKSHPANWAIEAIAARENVSEDVSEAVIDAENEPAGTILLENKTAQISKQTLEVVIEKSRQMTTWQRPVSAHRSLSKSMAEKLLEFVDDSVKKLLSKRQDFDEQTTEEITSAVKRRVDFEMSNQRDNHIPVATRVAAYAKDKKLNDETIGDAIAMRDKDFVIHALAHLIGTNIETIQRVFRIRKNSVVVALCWKAGLSMRTALRMQQEIAQIHPRELIYPRDGTDYPMAKDELEWQLDFLDLPSK